MLDRFRKATFFTLTRCMFPYSLKWCIESSMSYSKLANDCLFSPIPAYISPQPKLSLNLYRCLPVSCKFQLFLPYDLHLFFDYAFNCQLYIAEFSPLLSIVWILSDYLANLATSSFPSTPTWAGTHTKHTFISALCNLYRRLLDLKNNI